MGIAELILSLIQVAPSALNGITSLYNAVKGDLSSTDQAAIDAALLAAQNADWAATQKADDELDAAAKR